MQRAISERRASKHQLKVWVLMSCVNEGCASQEVNVFVDETQTGVKPWQAPCYCPRCRTELHFEGMAD
jgi:hypothetical protein